MATTSGNPPPAPHPEAHSEGAPVAEVSRKLIAHADIAAMPGFESRIYLVDYPPGVEGKTHVHTQQSAGYVIEGRFESAFGNGPVSVVHAGEGFVDLPRVPHHFRNPDPTRRLRFVLTGTFRKDEPIFDPAPGDLAAASWPSAPTAATTDSAAQGTPPSAPQPTEVKRTLLVQREIADLPGMESRIYLIEFPPGAASKLHIHSAQGIGYVLEGSFESAFGDDAAALTHTGEGFIDIPGRAHRFRNPDPERPLRFVVAGTYHKDEPLLRALPSG